MGGQPTALYLVGHDTLGWEDAGGWTYAVPDALGSVRQAVDATAAVVAAREWTPYGVEVGDAHAGLGYTGEWWDAAVGLQYLRARWYDVATGRFTQEDPREAQVLQPTSFHEYIYVFGNPLRFTDPTGEVPYDRYLAARYARDWATGINPVYGTFGGSDCTSFVSQALLAGNFPEDEQWFWEGRSLSKEPSRCSGEQCCQSWCGVLRLPGNKAHCGNAWALTDNLFRYLTIDKGFTSTTLVGSQEATGLDMNGASPQKGQLPAQSPVLPWANDWRDGLPHTEFLWVRGAVRVGDVTFYQQAHTDYVRTGGDFNHAAFVVDWAGQTRKGEHAVVDYDPPYYFVPWTPHIADHSSGASYLGIRALNDTYTEVNKIVIVHIPDDVPEPATPWVECK